MPMATSKPLDEQIVAVLTIPCTSEAAATVRGATERALADMIAEADAADAASLSPLATDAQAHEMRQRANELRFKADRFEAQVGALTARVSEMMEAERRSADQAERDAAMEERDELTADIARDYPRIVRELTLLAKRTIQSDARLKRAALHVQTAESIARGMSPHYDVRRPNALWIRNIVLEMPFEARRAWEDKGAGMMWPGLDIELPTATSEPSAEA